MGLLSSTDRRWCTWLGDPSEDTPCAAVGSSARACKVAGQGLAAEIIVWLVPKEVMLYLLTIPTDVQGHNGRCHRGKKVSNAGVQRGLIILPGIREKVGLIPRWQVRVASVPSQKHCHLCHSTESMPFWIGEYH